MGYKEARIARKLAKLRSRDLRADTLLFIARSGWSRPKSIMQHLLGKSYHRHLRSLAANVTTSNAIFSRISKDEGAGATSPMHQSSNPYWNAVGVARAEPGEIEKAMRSVWERCCAAPPLDYIYMGSEIHDVRASTSFDAVSNPQWPRALMSPRAPK